MTEDLDPDGEQQTQEAADRHETAGVVERLIAQADTFRVEPSQLTWAFQNEPQQECDHSSAYRRGQEGHRRLRAGLGHSSTVGDGGPGSPRLRPRNLWGG